MTQKWQNLINSLRKLPGTGPKMAERLALFLLRSPDTAQIVKSIQEARDHLRPCALCGAFTETVPCSRCVDPMRDPHTLCIIEEIGDLMALERTAAFNGHYHILGGVLSPLDGVGPKQLRIESLLIRLREAKPAIEEVILATNPTVEGEATATYLTELIRPLCTSVTRLAYGLPSGASLEYADELTLIRAFEGRQGVKSLLSPS